MRPVLDPGDSVNASFRKIVESHRREIMLHCYRFVGSLHDAEDLTQETFLRAWQSITRFEGRTIHPELGLSNRYKRLSDGDFEAFHSR